MMQRNVQRVVLRRDLERFAVLLWLAFMTVGTAFGVWRIVERQRRSDFTLTREPAIAEPFTCRTGETLTWSSGATAICRTPGASNRISYSGISENYGINGTSNGDVANYGVDPSDNRINYSGYIDADPVQSPGVNTPPTVLDASGSQANLGPTTWFALRTTGSYCANPSNDAYCAATGESSPQAPRANGCPDDRYRAGDECCHSDGWSVWCSSIEVRR